MTIGLARRRDDPALPRTVAGAFLRLLCTTPRLSPETVAAIFGGDGRRRRGGRRRGGRRHRRRLANAAARWQEELDNSSGDDWDGESSSDAGDDWDDDADVCFVLRAHLSAL